MVYNPSMFENERSRTEAQAGKSAVESQLERSGSTAKEVLRRRTVLRAFKSTVSKEARIHREAVEMYLRQIRAQEKESLKPEAKISVNTVPVPQTEHEHQLYNEVFKSAVEKYVNDFDLNVFTNKDLPKVDDILDMSQRTEVNTLVLANIPLERRKVAESLELDIQRRGTQTNPCDARSAIISQLEEAVETSSDFGLTQSTSSRHNALVWCLHRFKLADALLSDLELILSVSPTDVRYKKYHALSTAFAHAAKVYLATNSFKGLDQETQAILKPYEGILRKLSERVNKAYGTRLRKEERARNK